MHNRDLISLEEFLMSFCVAEIIWIRILGEPKKVYGKKGAAV